MRSERRRRLGQADHGHRGGADGGRVGAGRVVWLRWWLGGRGEEPVEAPGEVALQAAQRSLLGLALGLLAREIGPRVRVVAGAGDRDDVQRVVELAVAAAVEPPRSRWPDEHGIGAVPVW